MTSPYDLVLQHAPALGATRVQGKLNRLRFMSGAHVAFMTGQSGKKPLFTLEVHSIPDTSRRRTSRISVPEPPRVEFVREDRLARLGKLLLINREYQSGDPAFDALVYIHANGAPDAYIKHLLQHSGARDAIAALLTAGYDEVVIDAQASEGHARATRRDGPEDAEVLREHAALLAQIAAALPPCAPTRAMRRAEPLGVYLFYATLGGACCAPMLAFSLQHMWPIHGPRWSEPWWISATVWLGAVLLLIPILRGDSRSTLYLLLNACALAICIPCLMLPGLRAVNALTDLSEPRIIQADVLAKRRAHSQKATTYHVTLDLRDGTSPEERRVSARDYARVPASGKVEVALGAGALGWPWIARLGAK
jgi:hypothetical protein